MNTPQGWGLEVALRPVLQPDPGDSENPYNNTDQNLTSRHGETGTRKMEGQKNSGAESKATDDRLVAELALKNPAQKKRNT